MPPRPHSVPPTQACCEEYTAVSRRGLLTGATALAGTTALFGSTLLTASPARASAAAGGGGPSLVVLSLRGAADGLSLVVPHGDPIYYRARPRLAVPAATLLAKDAFFGLHPDLAPLVPLWKEGRMAVVHATGLPAPNRSHFAAMEAVEDADPGSSARVGWLNRLLGLDADANPLQGFSVGGDVVPTSLWGPSPIMSGGSVEDLQVAGDDRWDPEGRRLRSLHTLWDRSDSALAPSMAAAFRATRDVEPVRRTPPQTEHGADYGRSDLADALQLAARVIKGDVGTRVLTVDHGDWDMHTDLGTLEWGRMTQLTGELSRALAGFFTDLGPVGDRVTLVVLSEFGRRVQENANWGLDHGYGNAMFVLGAGVRGGRYYGSWPGLSDGPDADLPVTTDYRSVLAEVVAARFGVSTATVFPQFQPAPLELMRV